MTKSKPKVWHPEDIKAEVRKKGTTLSRLATDHGRHESLCRAALLRSSPVGERLIADFLNVPPEQLWPTRYAETGERRAGRHVRDENSLKHAAVHGQNAGAR